MKRKLRLRFSLRFLLVFMAIISFICYRYKQRTNFQFVANEIHRRGGAVFLRCQDPEIHNKYVMPSIKLQRYNVSVPDGLEGVKTQIKTQIKTRMVPVYHRTSFYAFNVNEFSTNDRHSKFRIIDFLSGSHSDVNFGTISIPASSADQDMIRLLSRIGGLEEILIMADHSFFTAERNEHFARMGISYKRHQAAQAELETELGATSIEEVRQATELIRVNFPEVSLYSRGLEWPYECPPSEIGEGGGLPKVFRRVSPLAGV